MPPKGKSKATKPSKTSKPSKTPNLPADKVPAPNWPLLSPLPAKSTLQLHSVLKSQILLLPHFFPPALCKTYLSFLSSLPFSTTPGIPKRGEAVRVNDRFQVHDPTFAERLWRETGLRDVLQGYREGDGAEAGADGGNVWGGELLGLNPNIRIYRYRLGQFFDKHYDESNRITFPVTNTNSSTAATATAGATGKVEKINVQAKTTWTLLIYLTRCEGGETVFYPEPTTRKGPQPEPVIVEGEPGLALLHRHGEDCMLHEGREVTKGEKWVLRSDVVVKR